MADQPATFLYPDKIYPFLDVQCANCAQHPGVSSVLGN
jgi:hypothetical protein